MPIQDTDTFLVNRSGTSYRVPASDFKTIGSSPWQTTAPPNATNSWEDVIFDGTKFVAVASSGQEMVIYSEDGANWTDRGGPPIGMRKIIYGNGVYVVARGNGDSLYYSESPTFNSWSAAYGSFDKPDPPIYGGCYGGPNNYYLLVGGGNNYGRSTNGKGWNELAKPTNDTWWGIAYGNGYYVAIQQSAIWYSATADAGSWTRVSVGTSNWKGIAFDGTKFVLVGDSASNRIAYATDVNNWTVIPSPSESSYWRGVAYGGGKFVAVAGGNTTPSPRLMTSFDGINWSLEDFPVYNNWGKVVYGGDKFVAVAGSGDDQRVLYSGEASNLGAGDICLVNRSGVSYRCDVTDLRTKVQENDLLLVNRNDVSYKATGADFLELFPVDMTGLFSTDLWFGNNSGQVISNGLNLTGDGGMVWIKNRQSGYDHQLYDTNMGATQYILPNDYNGQMQNDTGLTQFKADGYEVGSSAIVNQAGNNVVGWSFAKKPGFFDCLQYRGNGQNNHVINHDLGVEPGIIMIKETSSGGTKLYDWVVYCKQVGTNSFAKLNKADPFQPTNPLPFESTPTATSFELSTFGTVNASNRDYNAYLFADNGKTIASGTYVGNGTSTTVDVGFEPQFLIIKSVTATDNWNMFDAERGNDKNLYADDAAPERTTSNKLTAFTPNGFTVGNDADVNASGQTHMYLAVAAG